MVYDCRPMQSLALRTPSDESAIDRIKQRRVLLERTHNTSQSRLREVVIRQIQNTTHAINQIETRALATNTTHRARQKRRINPQLASKPPQAGASLFQQRRHLVAERALSTPIHQQTSRSNTTRACWSC